ncbi:hypothetical protein ACHWQZ_G009220 [Mnemiopsis leidyi]
MQDATITTYYLGSDQNEQGFAFVRTSFAGGRSRNLDAGKMAYGIERWNVRSELSLEEDRSVCAHTRGKRFSGQLSLLEQLNDLHQLP